MEALQLENTTRQFLPLQLEINSWEDIEPYFKDLANRSLDSAEALRQWLRDRSELEAFVSENLAWRYIRMTCYTDNETYQKDYTFFISEIEPKIAPFTNQLNTKALECPHFESLRDEGFKILKRNLSTQIKIYREANIPLFTAIQNLAKDFSTVAGAQTVEIDGQELTLQQAAVNLQSTDRKKRENTWLSIAQRRYQDKDTLDEIFTEQIRLRDKVGKNADFDNYRDYMFAALGRFDYQPDDCFAFHHSVHREIVPILNKLAEERKQKLQVSELRPWDKIVNPDGKPALKPFESPEELTEKTITCFSKLDPFLGQCMATLEEMNHLDLASRKGKAPGGYNYPLSETGVPFIFMNATSTLRDLVTLLHEGGHAVHSIVTRDLEITDFKSTPSEVAELASMSMELITMDHWDLFFDNADDLNRAKKDHLTQVIETLPWVATIDKFQHWIYENPDHNAADRKKAWVQIFEQFTDDVTDWSGYEDYKNFLWQKQLHLFEVPFYYIEYGFAQLGAIAVWKNYKENPGEALKSYLNALKLGYTRSIPEIYKAAEIKFDFSQEYISQLIRFVHDELEKVS